MIQDTPAFFDLQILELAGLILLEARLEKSSSSVNLKLLCHPVQQICARPIEDLAKPDIYFDEITAAADRSKLKDALEQYRKGEDRFPQLLPIRWCRPDGLELYTQHTLQLLYETSTYVCVHILVRSISAQAFFALERERWDMGWGLSSDPDDPTQRADFYELVVESVNDGILVNDPKGTILFMNENLARMLGYAPRELFGKHLFDLMDEEGILATKRRLANRRQGVAEVFDFRFVHRDGQDVWTRVSAKPLNDAQGEHLGSLVAISDISERKHAEEQLQVLLEELEARVQTRTQELSLSNQRLQSEITERKRAEELAQSANHAKSTFLANMSHELRTPLNAIIGYTELLAEDAQDNEDVPLFDDLGKIQGAAHHLLQLLNSILDLSKVEAGKMEAHYEPVSFEEMLFYIQSTMGELAKKNQNTLTIEKDPSLEYIWTDQLKLRQILFNLIGNANKFTQGGNISLRIFPETTYEQPRCVFEVRDSGIGIQPEELPRLFEAFEQIDPSSKQKYGGTGLGLAITKQFCKLLGGEISASSTLGQGSTFTFWLPWLTQEPDGAP